VVLDSALEEPFFIDRADSIKDEALHRFFGPTDTAADLPGTLSKTLEWLEETGVGTAEILGSIRHAKQQLGTGSEMQMSWKK
jgi:hypothetical protein